MAAPAATQQSPRNLFGLPGFTRLTEQNEANDQAAVTLSQTASVPFSAAVAFKNTDVIFWWELDLALAFTYTAGSGKTITASQYFPYNFIGAMKVQIQNVYPAVDFLSGIDAYIMQVIRPMERPDYRNQLEAVPTTTWAGLTTSLAANLANSGTNQGVTATAVNFSLQIPASLMFDLYYDLAQDGSVGASGERAIVSPQYMAGVRDVRPQITFNPGFGATSDGGPATLASGDTTSTFTAATATMGWRRRGVYGSNNPALMPPVRNWQLQRYSKQYSIAGVSKRDINLDPVGQILAVMWRMYDPSANSGSGGAITLDNLNVCRLIYGSGLLRYDDTPKVMQQRLIRQHGVLLPKGVGGWDLATDEFGRVTNHEALNTLSTAGCTLHFEWASAVSSTAYMVVIIEALCFVI